MGGRNGGEVIRILKAGANGAPSTVAFDLALGFSTEGEETSVVFNDFAFIQTGKDDGIDGMPGVERDIIVIASGAENKVNIIELRDDTAMSAKKNRRQVEWCVGTPFVWVDGAGEDEMYVLNVDTKEIVTTIMGLKSKKMISVENYAAKRTAELISQQINGAVTDLSGNLGSLLSASQSSAPNTVAEDDNDIDPVGIAALVVGLANMIYMARSNSHSGNDGGDS